VIIGFYSIGQRSGFALSLKGTLTSEVFLRDEYVSTSGVPLKSQRNE
jgi:hypothetical protein